MSPVISIIIPVYNAARFLQRLIDSILSQTYPHFEVLFIDDGSTDDSGAICDLYARKDDRIRVFHQTNQGVSAARNRGIEEAKGKYIMFVDADDDVAENILEKMLFAADTFKVDVVLCDAMPTTRISDIPTNQVLDNNFIINTLFSLWCMGDGCLTPVWAKLYRRELFFVHNIWFEQRKRGEDWLLNIQLFQCVKSIYYIPLPLYKYVRHGNSAMTAYLPEQFELWIENRRIWHHVIEKYRLQVDYKSFNTQWLTKVFYYLPFMVYSDNQYRKKLEEILHSTELYQACLYSYKLKPYSFQILKLLLKWNRTIEVAFMLRFMSWWIYKRNKK